MARKASQPALYELMRSARRERNRTPPPPEVPESPAPEPFPEPEPADGARRRLWRIPPGYLWVGGSAVAGVIVLAFSFGFLVRDRSQAAEQDRQWLALHGPSLPVPDPEGSPQGGLAPLARGPVQAQPQPQGLETVLPPGFGPIVSEPRNPGLNYFVLAYTPRENAIKLARFFRDQGVEAYAVKDKNASPYRVIAAPGYARGERGSEAVRALEARIAEAARKWKLEINSKDDLAYYPERYDGPEK